MSVMQSPWLWGAAAVVAIMIALVVTATRWPPIHDISTDLADPPRFIALLPYRTGRVSPPEYDGAATAARQRQSYPDIQPLTLAVPPAAAFAASAAAARNAGWQIVAADGDAGRIEAIATTRMMRFKDDIVVRIRPAGGGSRVDVRSKSRVGVGDLGTNARRIRAFLAAVASSSGSR